MEFRQRASPEQFNIIIDFMETHGDLSRLLPGSQGRLRSERLWSQLADILNSVGGSGIHKSVDKWKRVWSDWKTKTKKKASVINRDTQGTGGGPSRSRPLNPLEERVLRIIGHNAITGIQSVEEAGIELQAPQAPPQNIRQPSQHLSPPAAEVEVTITSNPEYNIECLDVTSTPQATPIPVNPPRHEDTQRPPSTVPSTPRRRRPIGQRSRRRQTPFEQATSEFVRIEDHRLQLEERRLQLNHELEERRLQLNHERDIEQLRVESQRNEIILRLAVTANSILEVLLRLENQRNN